MVGTVTIEFEPFGVTANPVSFQGPTGRLADCKPNEPDAVGHDNWRLLPIALACNTAGGAYGTAYEAERFGEASPIVNP